MSPHTAHAANHLGLSEFELAMAMHGEGARPVRMCGCALARNLVALGELRRTFGDRGIRVVLDGKIERAMATRGQVALVGPGASLQILNLPVAQTLVLMEPLLERASAMRFYDAHGKTILAAQTLDPTRSETDFAGAQKERAFRGGLSLNPGRLPLDSVRNFLSLMAHRSLETTLRVEARCGTLLHRSSPIAFSESSNAWGLSFGNLHITLDRAELSEGRLRHNPDNALEPWCIDVLDAVGEALLTCSVPEPALAFLCKSA